MTKTRKVKMNKCQENYLVANRSMDPKDLAKDTGLTVKAVRDYLKKLEPTRSEPAKIQHKFGISGGSVVMTPQQAMADDEIDRNPIKNQEFWEEHKDHIHLHGK